MLGMKAKGFGAAVCLGLGLGAAVWLGIGQDLTLSPSIAEAQTRLTWRSPDPPASSRVWARPSPSPFDGSPLPALVLRLDGISRMPNRSAVLVVVNAAAPIWIRVGETNNGFTLTKTQSGRITVETRDGEHEVALGQTKDLRAPLATQPVASANEVPPPGAKLPPEPASASIRGP